MGGWSSSGGGSASITPLYVGTNLVSQVNSTNAQSLRVYGTSDNTGVPTTNYSRLSISYTNVTGAVIASESGGTGTKGPININGDGSTGLSLDGTNGVTLQFSSGTKVFVGGTIINFYTAGAQRAGFDPVGTLTFNGGGTADVGINKNASGVLEINSNTLGTYRDLIARNVRTNPTTVASLTAAATAGAGARSFVTDATAPTFGATVAGGGAVSTPVYSNGTSWLVG